MKKTIALTGGGTAGHIMPNIALIPTLKKHFNNIIYIGGDGLEKELVPKYNLPFFSTDVVKFSRQKPFSNLKIPFVLNSGKKQAKEILLEHNVDVVFSKGGYASLPACYSAKALGIPVVTHESDFSLGLANKLIGRFATKVLTSFPETKGGILTGNPIREELFNGSAMRAKTNYKLGAKPVLLIFGGSLGAQSINNAVYSAIDDLTKIFHVVHIAGKNPKDITKSGYTLLKYAHDMNDLYAAASVVVIRGGANSLAETAALGKRTICIPLPKGNSRGDQVENAKSFSNLNLTNILYQDDLTPKSLIDLTTKTLNSPPPKAQKNLANQKIVDEIVDCLNH